MQGNKLHFTFKCNLLQYKIYFFSHWLDTSFSQIPLNHLQISLSFWNTVINIRGLNGLCSGLDVWICFATSGQIMSPLLFQLSAQIITRLKDIFFFLSEESHLQCIFSIYFSILCHSFLENYFCYLFLLLNLWLPPINLENKIMVQFLQCFNFVVFHSKPSLIYQYRCVPSGLQWPYISRCETFLSHSFDLPCKIINRSFWDFPKENNVLMDCRREITERSLLPKPPFLVV